MYFKNREQKISIRFEEKMRKFRDSRLFKIIRYGNETDGSNNEKAETFLIPKQTKFNIFVVKERMECKNENQTETLQRETDGEVIISWYLLHLEN